MKNKIAVIIGVLAFGLLTVRAQSSITVTNVVVQTNVVKYVDASIATNFIGNSAEAGLLQQAYDAAIGGSNGVFVLTWARKLSGNANRFSLDYIYNFTPNAGLILGYDDIRAGSYSQANVLKGGLTLNADIYPFKRFGATNFFVKSYGFALIATPTKGTSNNGGVGQLMGAGVSYEPHFTKNIYGEFGGFYENSTGEGQYNGNWVGALIGVHYIF